MSTLFGLEKKKKKYNSAMNNQEAKRGGCLDLLVMSMSIGFLGVETTERTYWVDNSNGQPITRQNLTQKAIETGQAQVRTKRTDISRRIVRNH